MPTIPPNNNTGLYGIDGSNVAISNDVTVDNLNATGNITAGGFITAQGNITAQNFIGNVVGNISGNVGVPGSNTNVLFNNNGNIGSDNNLTFNTNTNLLNVDGNVTATGTITGSMLTTSGPIGTGNIVGVNYAQANYFVGDGSLLTNVSASYGNANVSNYLASGTNTANIITTGNITGGNLTTSGNVISGGIKTDNYLYANGTPISFAGTYSNSNVTTLLAAFGSNTIVTSGNITAGNIIANGQALTNLPAANIVGTVANATYAINSNQANYANTANSVAGGNVTGNVANAVHAYFADVANNVSGSNVAGSVAQANYANTANSVAGGNVSGQVANALVAGTVYTAAQPAITSVGTLTSLAVTGNITSSANISGNYILGNGSQLTGLPATYGNANVAAYLPTYTGNLAGGNLEIGNNAHITNNLTVDGTIYGTFAGNISGNLVVPGSNTQVIYNNSGNAGASSDFTYNDATKVLDVNGNITGGNISATNTASANIVNVTTQVNTPKVYSNGDLSIVANGANINMIPVSMPIQNINMTSPNVNVTGQVSVSGNITTGGIKTDGYYYANGTPISFAGTYGNSNVNTLLASWGSNTLSTTGNVTAGNLIATGNVKLGSTGNGLIYVDSGDYTVVGSGNVSAGGVMISGDGTMLMGTLGGTGPVMITGYGTTYRSVGWDSGANLNFNILGSGAGNITNVNNYSGLGAITNTGNITGGNLISGTLTYTPTDGTAGQVLTTYGNGKTYFSTVSSGTYGDSNVVTLMSAFGSNTISTTGNITAGNILTNGYYYANGTPVSFGGSPAGSSLELQFNNAGSFGGVPGTAYYSGNGRLSLAGTTFEQSGSDSIVSVPGTGGYISVAGNVTAGNLISGTLTYTPTDGTAGQVLTTYGNGKTYFSTVSSGGSPGGNTTEIQFNNAGSFAGNAAMTFDNTTGNISFGNLVVGNIGSSGTFYNVLTNKNQFRGNSTTQPSNARILMGSGRSGDWSTTADIGSNGRNARLLVADEYVKADNGIRISEIAAIGYANLNSSTTYGSANVNSRIQGITSDLYLMNGNIVATSPYIARAGTFGLNIGTGANTNIANVSACHGLSAVVTTNIGSTSGNAYGMIGIITGSGVVTNQIAYGIQLAGNANSAGNAFGIYNPNNNNTFGITNSNSARASTNYYFLRNDDALAKNQVGQMNRYFDGFANCGGSSGGAVTINANNGQFQYLNITEAVTSISFTNFASYVNNTSSVPQPLADTVTLIITQDSTGRSITMPTSSGSNIYKYAGGITSVSTTANSVTMISITGVVDSSLNNLYLITISPEFS